MWVRTYHICRLIRDQSTNTTRIIAIHNPGTIGGSHLVNDNLLELCGWSLDPVRFPEQRVQRDEWYSQNFAQTRSRGGLLRPSPYQRNVPR